MLRELPLALLLSLAPLTAVASAQSGDLDQSSDASNAWLYCFEPANVWQQQVRAGLSGRLEAVELRLQGPVGAQVDVRLRAGDAWNVGPVVWSMLCTKADPGLEIVVLDVLAGDLLLSAGDTFVIEAQGNDTGAEIVGNYLHPSLGAPGYAEPLALSGPGEYEDGGWRMGFRTWMQTELATNYCTATPNSSGSPAAMSVSGSYSVAANDLVLHAAPLPAGQLGMFFYGGGAGASVLGNGLLCVDQNAGGLARLGVVAAGGGGELSAPLDVTAPPTPAAQITAGSTWYFQAWFRDPAGGGAGFNLSDGLEVTWLP